MKKMKKKKYKKGTKTLNDTNYGRNWEEKVGKHVKKKKWESEDLEATTRVLSWKTFYSNYIWAMGKSVSLPQTYNRV